MFSLNRGFYGSAIYNTGTLDVKNSTFDDNHAGYDGGAIADLGTMTVDNSAFSHNSGWNGGAIVTYGFFGQRSKTARSLAITAC